MGQLEEALRPVRAHTATDPRRLPPPVVLAAGTVPPNRPAAPAAMSKPATKRVREHKDDTEGAKSRRVELWFDHPLPAMPGLVRGEKFGHRYQLALRRLVASRDFAGIR